MLKTAADIHEFLNALPVSENYLCNYLEDQIATQQNFYWPNTYAPMPSAFYQILMDNHFRRSGRLFYRPQCQACQQCMPLRIDLNHFELTSSQKRVLKKNKRVRTQWNTPALTEEKLNLYIKYQQHRHQKYESINTFNQDTKSEIEDSDKNFAREDLFNFLYDSPTSTLETCYYIDTQLVAIGICDLTPSCLSSVYFYFDPDYHQQSLGVFSALCEMQYAKTTLHLPYYYLGYYIPQCKKMSYKALFGPHELLIGDTWVHQQTPLHL